jgi:hypothetical protein
MIGTVALRPLHYKTKARLRRSLLIPHVHLAQRPMWNSAHCNGPRVDERVTGLICNSFSIMTVCNLPLWEYSRDNPVLTPFPRRQLLKRTGGGALWSGADGPRHRAGRSATWREAAVLSGQARTVRGTGPDGPRPGAGARVSCLTAGRSAP